MSKIIDRKALDINVIDRIIDDAGFTEPMALNGFPKQQA
jgi:hypothetical protein